MALEGRFILEINTFAERHKSVTNVHRYELKLPVFVLQKHRRTEEGIFKDNGSK